MDVHLPDLDGFEVTRRLRRLARPPEVVLTSSRDAADFGSLVAECGARGFVPKDALSLASICALLT